MPNDNPHPTTHDYRRTIIGVSAIIFAIGAVGCLKWPPTQGIGLEWESACWRLAPIFAVIWLAYDNLKRIPRWLWFVMPIAIFVLYKWKYLLLLFIPLAIILELLKPRIKNREPV